MRILGIIPARYASTRFPGKPLADIHGKPMIQRVYEQAKKCKLLSEVVVATDDSRIEEAVKKFKGKAILTSSKHESGTDRCREAAEKAGEKYDAVINIQGDEPFIQPGQIEKLAKCLSNKKVQIATLAKPITDAHDLADRNTVKVTFDKNMEAINFSRTPTPHSPYKHIGIYGYRADVLSEITKLSRSSREIAESLEQLRWLENGYKISVEITEHDAVSIDTPEDLERALKKIPG